MTEDYSLTTPEAVTVSFRVSGLGTRMLATLIDSLIWLVVLILIGIVVFAYSGLGDMGQTVAVILGGTLLFLLLWGYYIVFETLWSGQTPGKRMMHIRVLKTSGYPIGFVDAVIRNLVRVADFLPSFYVIGIIVMFISPQSRRLGDYAAGTIVVKERDRISLHDLSASASRGRRMTGHIPARGSSDPDELQWNLDAITSDDLMIVTEYLDRAPTLDYAPRLRIGNDIARHIAGRIGAREPFDAERFLQRVVELQYREATE